MDTQAIVECICRLPADFYGGSKSMTQLIIESGIEKRSSVLTIPNISAYISNHLELVELWLRWSANKRASSGWYFTHQSNEYVVSFYPKGEALSFSQPELACAEYVVREVQSLIP